VEKKEGETMNIAYIVCGFFVAVVSLWMLATWNSGRSVRWRRGHVGRATDLLVSLSIFLLLMVGLYYVWAGVWGVI
jgi:uncharacterized membrane protein